MLKRPAKDYSSTVQLFLDSRKSKETRRIYVRGLDVITSGDPAGFLQRAKEDKDAAETHLITWILKNKESLKESTFDCYLAGLKSLCDFSDVIVNWKKVKSTVPDSLTGQEGIPELSQIRKLYEHFTQRERFAVSYFVSTGARCGSIMFESKGEYDYLKVGDIEEIPELGIAAVRIYRGCKEEYFSFLNSEALEDFHNYLDYRRRFGEVITPESPVFRRIYNRAGENPKDEEEKQNVVLPASSDSIKHLILIGWTEIGLKERNFPAVHGFRSYFKTQLSDRSTLKDGQIERLMGHALKTVKNRYYRPDIEQLGRLYAQNQSCLFISEGKINGLRIAELEEEKDAKISKLDQKLTEKDSQINFL